MSDSDTNSSIPPNEPLEIMHASMARHYAAGFLDDYDFRVFLTRLHMTCWACRLLVEDHWQDPVLEYAEPPIEDADPPVGDADIVSE